MPRVVPLGIFIACFPMGRLSADIFAIMTEDRPSKSPWIPVYGTLLCNKMRQVIPFALYERLFALF